MFASSRKILLLLGVALIASTQLVPSLAAEESAVTEESTPTKDSEQVVEENLEDEDEEEDEWDGLEEEEMDGLEDEEEYYQGFSPYDPGDPENEDFSDMEEPQVNWVKEGAFMEDCENMMCVGKAYLQNKTVSTEFPPVEIPDFTHGGIIVYFHLYKTGGSSITELMVETKGDTEEDMEFQEQETVKFHNNRRDMTTIDIMRSVQMVKRGKTVFYNFHVEFPHTMFPTLVEAVPVLDEWKRYAKANGVPIFVTTVLREPLGQALSFFNFFHVVVDEEDAEWSPFTGDLEPTEENFLKTYVPNRMCHLMYDDAHGILEAPDFALREGLLEQIEVFMDEDEKDRRSKESDCDVEVVRKILFGGTFDFVGVTDRLSTHILPMFSQMVFGDKTWAQQAPKKKDVNEMFGEDEMPPLKKDKLSQETKDMVAEKSAKDQQLYNEALERYAHWPAYFTKKELDEL